MGCEDGLGSWYVGSMGLGEIMFEDWVLVCSVDSWRSSVGDGNNDNEAYEFKQQ
jgi:hypothetical protein